MGFYIIALGINMLVSYKIEIFSIFFTNRHYFPYYTIVAMIAINISGFRFYKLNNKNIPSYFYRLLDSFSSGATFSHNFSLFYFV